MFGIKIIANYALTIVKEIQDMSKLMTDWIGRTAINLEESLTMSVVVKNEFLAFAFCMRIRIEKKNSFLFGYQLARKQTQKYSINCRRNTVD